MKKNKLFFILSFVLIFTSQMYGSQAWKSMILPGWGQSKMGYVDKGKLFLLSEYIMWSGFIFSDGQYSSYRSDYRDYGEHYADVSWSEKNDLFAANVGNYISLDSYNNDKAQQFLHNDMYPTHGDIDYSWSWEANPEQRFKYDALRNKSENYDKAKSFIVAGIIINRIVSFLDVIILERKNILTSEVTYGQNHTANLKIHYNF